MCRHPGEGRGPVVGMHLPAKTGLDTGLRRYDTMNFLKALELKARVAQQTIKHRSKVGGNEVNSIKKNKGSM
jgi:hypothetical protein